MGADFAGESPVRVGLSGRNASDRAGYQARGLLPGKSTSEGPHAVQCFGPVPGKS